MAGVETREQIASCALPNTQDELTKVLRVTVINSSYQAGVLVQN
jgi:hypothetical protein